MAPTLLPGRGSLFLLKEELEHGAAPHFLPSAEVGGLGPPIASLI